MDGWSKPLFTLLIENVLGFFLLFATLEFERTYNCFRKGVVCAVNLI